MKKLLLALTCAASLFASIDINHADVKELSSLKGIGHKKAEAIIAYRKAHCFKNVDEIVKVKGIGKKFLAKHKDELKAGSCKK